MRKKSWDDWFAKFVLDPTTRYIMLWNALMTIVYLVSIFFDFLIIGFHLRPLLTPAVTNCSTVLSAMMLIDVVLRFFQAFKANQTELVNEDNDNDEKDRRGEALDVHEHFGSLWFIPTFLRRPRRFDHFPD